MTTDVPGEDSLRNVPFLYLTTTGRRTGRPREIEIWFVASEGRFYVLAEHFHNAHWVKNIERTPRVHIHLADREFHATAYVLDPRQDADEWRLAQGLAREKYGWGDGLPVRITPDKAV